MIIIINKNSHHHIVGVQALCLCNLENITALSHVAASLRIVLPAFNLFNSLIYNGYNIIAPMKVASVKLRIRIKLFNMFNISLVKISYWINSVFLMLKSKSNLILIYI